MMRLVCFLAYTVRHCIMAIRLAPRGDKVILLGVAGSLLAVILGSWHGSFMIRGVQFIAVTIFALPDAIMTSRAHAPQNPQT